MPTTKKLDNLNVNVLTKSQYDTAVAQGVITDEDLSMITDLGNDIVPQYEQMPVASAENVNQIAQYSGATDSTYTNGYFYKCVSDGQSPATYSWTRVDVQPTPSGLPDQTGQSGKFLTTDGTDASWSDKPLANKAPNDRHSLVVSRSGSLNTYPYYSIVIVDTLSPFASYGSYSITLGYSNARASGNGSIAIGYNAKTSAINAIEIASGDSGYTNSDANTFKVGNANGNFEIMSADGTVPEARLADTTSAQQGDVLTLDSTGNAVWQASSGGGLPSQTGQSGKFLTTDGTDASWSDKPLVNIATGADAVGISNSAAAQTITGISAIAINGNVSARAGIKMGIGSVSGIGGIALGERSNVSADGAIQINTKWDTRATNSDANTFKVANANGNFEIMSADGTVPTARLTKVNTTATLAVADWSSSTQTVTVSGVKADSVVFVSPAPASASDYASAGILCTSQSADSLTFTCTTTPSNAITVNVICL